MITKEQQKTAQKRYSQARHHDNHDFKDHMAPGIVHGGKAPLHDKRINKTIVFKVNHDSVLDTAQRSHDHDAFSEKEHTRIDNHDKIKK